jgi:hypothetical protein
LQCANRSLCGRLSATKQSKLTVCRQLVHWPETGFGQVDQHLAVRETLPPGIQTGRSPRRQGRFKCGCPTRPVQEVPSGSPYSRPWSCFRRRRVIRTGVTIENARVGSSRRGIAGSRTSSGNEIPRETEFLDSVRHPAPPSPGGMRTGIPLRHGWAQVFRFARRFRMQFSPTPGLLR